MPEADDAVISAAYRALARRHHPDLAGEAGTARMRLINAAWEVLRDPAKRRAHDLTRHRASSPADRGGFDTTGHAVGAAASRNGTGGAGRPPGRPSGSMLDFGRHLGWSIGEVARVDPGYLEWLESRPEGAPYRGEIDTVLRRAGRRREPAGPVSERRGWFSR
jgi:curved DNA-binding protein CbpA